MKWFFSVASVLLFLLILSCAESPSVTSSLTINNGPIRLNLVLLTNEFHSFDEINFQVVLANQGDKSILVHSRLHHVAIPVPASISEMLILIFDSSGNRIAREYHPNYALPSIDTLEELQPGDQVTQIFYLRTSGFFDRSLFKQGEKYTIVAIYQNDINTMKTINGIEVPSWVGSIESNRVTFTILP